MSAPSPIVGIDLGTTNSLVAVSGWPEPTDRPRVLHQAGDGPLLPSVVRFGPRGAAVVVGARALDDPAQPGAAGWTLSSVKRLMGRSLRDAQADLPYLPFQVVAADADTARMQLPDGRSVTPQEVSAHVLLELKRIASAALGVDVSRAVITVPAYFDDAQRQATRDAARMAGLEAVRLVAEPTAAALAYGLGIHARSQPQNVVVYDLGGGTFDVSVLRITPGVGASGSAPGADAFEVLATHGDTHLGGDDFDHAIVRWVIEQAAAQHPNLPAPSDAARASLRTLAQHAKIALSTSQSTTIDLAGELGPGLSPLTLSRTTFDGLIYALVDRTIASCKRALRDAARQLAGEPVHAVVLVGGATRTPLVKARVAECFGIEPYTAVDPDQAVALGAAVQAAVLAAAQTGTATSAPRALLLDVVPLSLGIETANGAFAKLIMRNAPIPAHAHEMFSTQADGQTAVKLHVLQGEREMAADCRSLAVYHLRGIPAMPAGIPQLRVEFVVDANGLLTVNALEQRSGKRLSVQVVPHHGLNEQEVQRIERESFAHARQDMARHRIADLLANSSLDLRWIVRQLAVAGDALSQPQRAPIEAAVQRLQSFVDRAQRDWSSVQPDEFHAAKEALDRASIPLHEASIRRSLTDDPPSAHHP